MISKQITIIGAKSVGKTFIAKKITSDFKPVKAVSAELYIRRCGESKIYIWDVSTTGNLAGLYTSRSDIVVMVYDSTSYVSFLEIKKAYEFFSKYEHIKKNTEIVVICNRYGNGLVNCKQYALSIGAKYINMSYVDNKGLDELEAYISGDRPKTIYETINKTWSTVKSYFNF